MRSPGSTKFRDLPATVAQGLVAEGPAFEQREELIGGRGLAQYGRAGTGTKLAELDRGDEVDLVAADLGENLAGPQRTLAARHLVAEGRERGHGEAPRDRQKSICQSLKTGWTGKP
jgi:hypothetical protein